MLVIGIPLAFIIRHRPEQYGYLPDGQLKGTEETSKRETGMNNHPAETNYTLWQAIKTRAFWMLTIGMALTSLNTSILPINAVPFLYDQGLSFEVTLEINKLAPLMGLVGILLFGYLGDRFPKRYLLASAVALQSASMIIFMTAGTTTQLYLYTLIYGLGSGVARARSGRRGLIPLLEVFRIDVRAILETMGRCPGLRVLRRDLGKAGTS